jgi:two-component system, sensor histidine kinase RpfC
MSADAGSPQSSRAFLGSLSGRLRGRPDSEHEMSFNRLVFAFLIVIILVVGGQFNSARDALVSMAVYIVLALAVLGHIFLFPGISQPRRLFALVLDCIFLSWQLHLGGERVALFYPVYLWVIFGNGFRFGIRFLFAAVPVATLSFALVVATTPFWSTQPHLSAGLLIGLIILPAYAGTLIRKLSLATKAAEEASKAKSLFLASVSHELRTPLTAIIGMNGLLRTSVLNDAQREMVETVDVAGRSLESLINQLLDLSRIEAGRMTSAAEDFDLLTLLVDVRRIMESQVQAKNLAFDIHVTPRTPLRLRTSRLHLQEILVNLVGNAVKFTEMGGVVIAVDGQPLDGPESDFILRVEVSDTGIGIASQAQTKIFESFTQGDATILNRFGGTGLGLAITRSLVRLLGGEIEVKSAPGKGSTFGFYIKAANASAAIEDQWLAPKCKVGLLVWNPVESIRLQAHLASMGIEVVNVTPSPGAGDRQFAWKGSQVLLAYDFEREDSNQAITGWALRPKTVLIRQKTKPDLPDMPMRKRCVALLSDDFSERDLRQALLIATRLSAPDVLQAPELAATVTALPLPAVERRRRVLLVDDNRVNRRVFTRILEAAGHEVFVADNGNSALDILEREGRRLDIVLMDFNMPEMDGLEATKLYRMMSLGDTRLPIVGLTADAFAQADGAWREAGMDGCLVKPVAPQDLVAAVESMSRTNVVTKPIAANNPRDRARLCLTQAMPGLDETIIVNLRQLGDSKFFNELMADFLSDAKNLIDMLASAAARGDWQEFRSSAHALRSSAANVGATALGELCEPWLGLRSSELHARATEFATHAQSELVRTQQAIMSLSAIRRVNNV